MENDLIIQKWLDGSISDPELAAFQQTDSYAAFMKLSEKAIHFKAPEFDKKTEYEKLKFYVSQHKKDVSKNNWLKPLLRIAAVITVVFGLYFSSFHGRSIDINTLAAEKTEVLLPDNSEVFINAESSLTYDKKSWSQNREVALNGEAYFKVAKGATFDVTTKTATVRVVGTQFNVKARASYFEVQCFEGHVKVLNNGTTEDLYAGESLRIVNNIPAVKNKTKALAPSWTKDISTFDSVPLKEVLAELKRQYKITIEANSINEKQLFTGSFDHNDLQTALKSISIPLQLSYFVNDTNVRFEKRD